MKIGTDIVEISRIESSLEKFGDRFKERFLNEEEAEYVQKAESIAGYWAAKEAVAKALGCGIGKELGFHDIYIKNSSNGMPSFELSSNAQIVFPIRNSSLSISHDGGFAIAVVVVEL